MPTPTMVYKPASATSNPANVVETEQGKVEWLIVDMDDGAAPPAGWSLAINAASQPRKVRKPKADEPVSGDGDSN